MWDRPQQRLGSRVATKDRPWWQYRHRGNGTSLLIRPFRFGSRVSQHGRTCPTAFSSPAFPSLLAQAGCGHAVRGVRRAPSAARRIPGPTPRSLVAHSHVSVVERGLGLSLGLLWALLIHEDGAPTECIKCALSCGDNRSRRISCSGQDSKASPCGDPGTVFLRRSHKGLGTQHCELSSGLAPPVSEPLCPSGPLLTLQRFREHLRRGSRGQ